MHKFKAVLFDMDGVLYDSKHANAVWYQRVLKELGHNPPSLKYIYKFGGHDIRTNLKIFTKERSKEKLEKIFEFAMKVPYPGEMVRTPDGLRGTLSTLSKKYKLAIVTNSVRVGVEDEFKVDDISEYFDAIITLDDVTHPKPHPEPIRTAMKRLGVKRSETVYVGDNMIDIKAASGAGVPIIIYAKKPIKEADWNVKQFSKIPSAITRLESSYPTISRKSGSSR